MTEVMPAAEATFRCRSCGNAVSPRNQRCPSCKKRVRPLQAAGRQRPPAAPPPAAPVTARCERCRRWPATTATFRQVVGTVLVFRLNTTRGRYCRDCGVAVARRATNSTLVTGWWGLVAIPANLVVLAVNTRNRRRVRTLGAPRR